MKKFVLIKGLLYSNQDIAVEYRIDINSINKYNLIVYNQVYSYGTSGVIYNRYYLHIKDEKDDINLYYKTEKEVNDVLEFLDYHTSCIKMTDIVLEEVYQAN